MGKNNIKAQTWFMDFVIALIIFTFVLISYYTYTANISKQDSSAMNNLISDSKTVSSSFTSRGYPTDWNSNNVVRIGFTDDYNRIDGTLFSEFMEINYNKTKKLLGTNYDYLLYFVNGSNDVQNVEGFCGTGLSEVEITYDVSAAYYYLGGEDDDQFLRQFMSDKFDAKIYTPSGSGEDEYGNPVDVTGTLCDLTNNINSYGVVVLESPEMSAGVPCGKFGAFKTAAQPWVEGGGFLMISGLLSSAEGTQFVGVTFRKEAGLSKTDEHATIVKEDIYLPFELTAGLIFNQGFTVENAYLTPAAVNFKNISNFNESDLLYEDILDNIVAIARWEYGNGKVLFFSDFRTQYLVGDFQEILEASTTRWIGAMCLPIDITGLERSNLVKTERMVIHDSDLLKMVLYLWE